MARKPRQQWSAAYQARIASYERRHPGATKAEARGHAEEPAAREAISKRRASGRNAAAQRRGYLDAADQRRTRAKLRRLLDAQDPSKDIFYQDHRTQADRAIMVLSGSEGWGMTMPQLDRDYLIAALADRDLHTYPLDLNPNP